MKFVNFWYRWCIGKSGLEWTRISVFYCCIIGKAFLSTNRVWYVSFWIIENETVVAKIFRWSFILLPIYCHACCPSFAFNLHNAVTTQLLVFYPLLEIWKSFWLTFRMKLNTINEKTPSDNLCPYEGRFFRFSNFSRQPVALWGEVVRLTWYSQKSCLGKLVDLISFLNQSVCHHFVFSSGCFNHETSFLNKKPHIESVLKMKRLIDSPFWGWFFVLCWVCHFAVSPKKVYCN